MGLRTGYTGLVTAMTFLIFMAVAAFADPPEPQPPPDWVEWSRKWAKEDWDKDCNKDAFFQNFCYRSYGVTKQARTVAGILMIQETSTLDHIRDHKLWLEEKELAHAKWLAFDNAFLEKNELPSLFTVNISPRPYSDVVEDENVGNKFNFLYIHVVDVGVSPPFVSKERLPITGVRNENGNRVHLEIKKIDEDTYIISGETLPDKDGRHKPIKQSVKYDRKTRTITRVD